MQANFFFSKEKGSKDKMSTFMSLKKPLFIDSLNLKIRISSLGAIEIDEVPGTR